MDDSKEYIMHKHINSDGSIITKMIEKPKPNLLKNLAETTVDLAQGGFTSEEIANQRLEICKACPELIPGTRCRLCGCYMVVKTKVANARCPAHRWPDDLQEKGRVVALDGLAGAEKLDKPS